MLTFTKIYLCHRVGQNEHLHDSNEKIEFEGNIIEKNVLCTSRVLGDISTILQDSWQQFRACYLATDQSLT